MPSFKPTELWPAKPHTLAKVEIVQRYLRAWYLILGRSPQRGRLLYIDGFAGPGEYSNSDQSSPIAAMTAAKTALEQPGSGLSSKEFCFLFVEKNKAFADNLRSVISATDWPTQFNWSVEEGTFEEQIGGILEDAKTQHQCLAPTFAFIDPFGATGLPFSIVSDILRHPCCEVLLNLDSDGIGRLVTAQNFVKNKANLDTLFGDSSWKTELDPTLPMARLSAQVLLLYKKRLRSLPNVRYVFAFAMNSREGQLNYHLVFASQHPRGLEKMKEAMKAVDQTGAYTFSDDTVSQNLLPFDFTTPSLWAQQMHNALAGRWRPYNEFHDYALNDTPFTNPKSMLEHLKTQGKIQIQWQGQPARRGFPEHKIKLIRLDN